MTSLSDSAAPRRVLFTLPEEERLFFFPAFPEAVGGTSFATLRRDAEWETELALQRPEIVVSGWSSPPLPRAWIESPGCSLRYVCHLTGSVKGKVPRAFLERGGRVTNWGDIVPPHVAEQALLLALAALRNLGRWREIQPHTGLPARLLGTRSLFGKRVGIHGFGRIARALIPLLQPFGVRIAVFAGGVPDALIRQAGAVPRPTLANLFSDSEVLFECEALTPATEQSVDGPTLAQLPDGAVFVNVGRGKLVDEEALLREARAGRLRLALDVVAREPLSHDSELFQLPGAILSPHIGGPVAECFPECGALALRNIARYLRDEPLEAPVTLDDYDRST